MIPDEKILEVIGYWNKWIYSQQLKPREIIDRILKIHDKGKIGAINKQLQSIQEIGKMKYGHSNFLPHISISQFQNKQQFNRLIRYLEKLRETEFGEITVNYIELVNAHLSGKYPILKPVHTFRLR